MLDPVTMKLLGKLKVLAKHYGTHIDLVKMAEGSDYAELTLKQLSNSEDPELILIVIKLMKYFGLIEAPLDLERTVEVSDKDPYLKDLG